MFSLNVSSSPTREGLACQDGVPLPLKLSPPRSSPARPPYSFNVFFKRPQDYLYCPHRIYIVPRFSRPLFPYPPPPLPFFLVLLCPRKLGPFLTLFFFFFFFLTHAPPPPPVFFPPQGPPYFEVSSSKVPDDMFLQFLLFFPRQGSWVFFFCGGYLLPCGLFCTLNPAILATHLTVRKVLFLLTTS